MNSLLKLVTTAIILLSTTAVHATPIESNPIWPGGYCGDSTLGDRYIVLKYMRMYPTPEVAIEVETSGNYDQDRIISTLQKPIDGVYQVIYTPVNLVAGNPALLEPVPVTMVAWVKKEDIDIDFFKLRQAGGKEIRRYNFGDEDDLSVIQPSFLAAMDNYLCISNFGDFSDGFGLVFIKGYVLRKGQLQDYVKPL